MQIKPEHLVDEQLSAVFPTDLGSDIGPIMLYSFGLENGKVHSFEMRDHDALHVVITPKAGETIEELRARIKDKMEA